MGTVWIVGSAGFIGRHLRRRLSEEPAPPSVLCIDRDGSDSALGEHEQLITAELGRPEDHEALFERLAPEAADCDAVVFLAAYYDFSNRPSPAYASFHTGFEAFADWTFAHVSPDTPFVYASSMAALEPTEPGLPLGPDGPRSSSWAYPAAKRHCEGFLERHPSERTVLELVVAGVYSEDCELVPLFQSLELARAGGIESRFYPADPDRGLTYVHIEDTCAAFLSAMRTQHERGVHRYLVGEPAPCTQREIMDTASRFFRGQPWRPVRVPRAAAALGARGLSGWRRFRRRRSFYQPWMMRFAGEHYEMDLRATQVGLDWWPERSLAKTLPDMLARAASDPDRWLAVNRLRRW